MKRENNHWQGSELHFEGRDIARHLKWRMVYVDEAIELSCMAMRLENEDRYEPAVEVVAAEVLCHEANHMLRVQPHRGYEMFFESAGALVWYRCFGATLICLEQA